MKDEKKETAPRGHGPGPVEKPKDFKTAITKLFHHLKPWRTLIYISLILAAVGSILSFVAPNRLSDLTNEIQKGIVVNTDNLSLITEHITEPLKDENVKERNRKEICFICNKPVFLRTGSGFYKARGAWRVADLVRRECDEL